jgi:nitroreductase
MGSRQDYEKATSAFRGPLGRPADLSELIRWASLAASGHNVQPWRFRISSQSITIVPDFSRRTPVVDPDDHHLFVSLGCAAENLALAAGSRGLPGETRFDSAGSGQVVFEYSRGVERPSPMADAIPHRQSTRAEFDGRPVSAGDLASLARAAGSSAVEVSLVTDRRRMGIIRDLVVAGNTAQMEDRAFREELKRWMRFNQRDAIERGDGILSIASGNPALPTWLGRSMFDIAFRADAENEKYSRHIASSAGLAIFVGARADPAHWVAVGRACQRFALMATALGLRIAFINQPVEIASLRPDLAAVIGMAGHRPDLVMRFGYGPLMPLSPRRPVAAVVEV